MAQSMRTLARKALYVVSIVTLAVFFMSALLLLLYTPG